MKEYPNSRVLLIEGDLHKISSQSLAEADFVFQKFKDGSCSIFKNRIGPIGPIGTINELSSNKLSKDDLTDNVFNFIGALDGDFNKLKTLVEFVDFCFEKQEKKCIDEYLELAG